MFRNIFAAVALCLCVGLAVAPNVAMATSQCEPSILELEEILNSLPSLDETPFE